MKNTTAILGALLMSSALPSLAHAQAADETPQAGAGGDIVVTAQRRAQNVQDVGIAITAVTDRDIQAYNVVSSVDVAKIAPNVAVSASFAGQSSQFTMRGVTQSDFNDHVESAIAVYVDDGYIAMQQGQSFGMFDLDHIEMLKGPQGTLFGRNATGGVVNYLTKRPTDKLDGYLDVTYGSYNNVRLEGALSGRVIGGIRGRISGFFERYDGYIRNKYPEETFVPAAYQAGLGTDPVPGAGSDLGGVKGNWALRGQLEGDLSDRTSLWVSASYGQSIASTGPYQSTPTVAILDAAGNVTNVIHASSTNVCQMIQAGACVHAAYSPYAGATRPVAGADFFGYTDPDGNGPVTSADYTFGNVNRTKSYGVMAKLTSDLGFGDLVAISDYKHFDKNFNLDLDSGPANYFIWHNTAKQDSFSQEVRLSGKSGGLNWIGGAYFLSIWNQGVSGLVALPSSVYSFPAFDQPRMVKLNSKSYSGFAQLEYAIRDNISVIAGARMSRDIKDYDFQVLLVTPTTGLNPYTWNFAPTLDFPGFSQGLYQGHQENTLWSWKAQVNWHPADDVLIYAGVTQGAKSGSFNAGGPPLAPADIPYKPERLISYEAGFKSTLIDRRLKFNASAFYYDYKNYQAAQWFGLSGSTLIFNAPAYIYGAEAELAATPTDNLNINFNIGYQDNRVKDVPIGGALRDVHTTFAPKWTLSAAVRYTVPRPVAGGEATLQVDGNYQSSIYQNLNNFDANKLKGWGIVNASLNWIAPDPRWEVTLFARNILNKWYNIGGYDLSAICGCNETAQGKPRWIGVKISRSLR